jgi:hypothetical protein
MIFVPKNKYIFVPTTIWDNMMLVVTSVVTVHLNNQQKDELKQQFALRVSH